MKRLPDTPRQLRRQLLGMLSLTGAAVAAVAAGVAYVITVGHVEDRVVRDVSAGLAHFTESSWSREGDAHAAVVPLLDPEHFVGVRLRGGEGRTPTDIWAVGLDPARQAAVQGAAAQGERILFRAGDDVIVRIRRPLATGTGTAAYAEALYRLDPATAHAIDPQPRNAALTSAAAVAITAIALYPVLLGLTRRSLRLSQDLLRSNLELMRALGSAIALRDSDTDHHNYRVTLYAVSLAEAIGMTRKEIADLVAGAFLHDVGKIGVADAILRKPGRLDDEEMLTMKQHPLLGAALVGQSEWLARALPVVRHHHERYDGSGYPDGLAGERIPLAARAFAIADVFDALTSRRPYKEPMSAEDSLRTMRIDMRGKLDPVLLKRWSLLAPELLQRVGQAGIDVLRVRLAATVESYFAAAGAPQAGFGASGEDSPQMSVWQARDSRSQG